MGRPSTPWVGWPAQPSPSLSSGAFWTFLRLWASVPWRLPIGWCSLGQGDFLGFARSTQLPAAQLAGGPGGVPGGSSLPQGKEAGNRQACWAGARLPSRAGGRSQLLRPAPPHLSLFRGYLVQGLVPRCLWPGLGSIKREDGWFLSILPHLAWALQLRHGLDPPPVPSAWDSPPLWGNAVPWVSPLLHLGNQGSCSLGREGGDPCSTQQVHDHECDLPLSLPRSLSHKMPELSLVHDPLTHPFSGTFSLTDAYLFSTKFLSPPSGPLLLSSAKDTSPGS